MRLSRASILGSLVAVFLLACGGGGGGDDTPPPPPPPTGGIYINAGGPDIADTDWKADAFFNEVGSATYDNADEKDLSQLSDPKPPAEIFNTERYGQPDMTYTITGLTASAPYTVTLYNQDTFITDVDLRLFSVEINGATVLTDYDIFEAAGGNRIAVEESFDVTASDAGEIVIHFTPNVENPKICGIRVVPTVVAAQ